MQRLLFRTAILAAGAVAIAAGSIIGCAGHGAIVIADSPVAIGEALFNDPTLSTPPGQSCATCHQQANAFTDPRQDSPTSEGATAGLFGNRQTPTISYMSFSPRFGVDPVRRDYIGGQFWDGRATDLKDQVHFPLLNPAEMNNADIEAIVNKVRLTPAGDAMRRLYGPNVFDDTDSAFAEIAECIALFESTQIFAPFSSKYDAVLRGNATLTPAEARGLALFNGKAACAQCHPSAPGPGGEPPLFTDFSYANIGVPKNPANPFYGMPANINPDGAAFIDHGLMSTTKRSFDDGRMKTPTLRNIAITAPYFHNGFSPSLEHAIDFYNDRDSGRFGPPEVAANVNHAQVGNLGLTAEERSDIVVFLETLTDGYRA